MITVSECITVDDLKAEVEGNPQNGEVTVRFRIDCYGVGSKKTATRALDQLVRFLGEVHKATGRVQHANKEIQNG